MQVNLSFSTFIHIVMTLFLFQNRKMIQVTAVPVTQLALLKQMERETQHQILTMIKEALLAVDFKVAPHHQVILHRLLSG